MARSKQQKQQHNQNENGRQRQTDIPAGNDDKKLKGPNRPAE